MKALSIELELEDLEYYQKEAVFDEILQHVPTESSISNLAASWTQAWDNLGDEYAEVKKMISE